MLIAGSVNKGLIWIAHDRLGLKNKVFWRRMPVFFVTKWSRDGFLSKFVYWPPPENSWPNGMKLKNLQVHHDINVKCKQMQELNYIILIIMSNVDVRIVQASNIIHVAKYEMRNENVSPVGIYSSYLILARFPSKVLISNTLFDPEL